MDRKQYCLKKSEAKLAL